MISIEDYINIQRTYGNPNIELTYRCPLQCTQCLRSYLFDDKNYNKIYLKNKISSSNDITLDDFRKLCNFFNNIISLSGQISDPIFHRDFYEILKICTEEYPNKFFKIHTAAHQKNIEWYKRAFLLSGSNIKWIFGLDGFPDVSYLYRKNQNSQLVFDAMMLGKSMNVSVAWQFIVFKFNEHQIEEARNFCKSNEIEFRLIYTDRKTGSENILSENFISSGPVKEYRN